MKCKKTVEEMQFDLEKPIDSIFNAVKDLAKISELANKPFTDP